MVFGPVLYIRRGIKLSFFPHRRFCRRRRLSLSVWQNAKRRASLRTGCDEPMRCIDTSPGRCARALRVVQRSSRVFFAFECSKKETRRGQTLGEVIDRRRKKAKNRISFWFFAQNEISKIVSKKKRNFKKKKKKERKRRKPSFLKKERKILIVADVVVEKIFFTPRYFTHSLRKRSRSMNCKA